MSKTLLMPKATAVWLVENTSLTFDQIANFCTLHPLEVKGIADGDVATGIKGMDPIVSGQLTREEIERGQRDANYRLRISESKVDIPEVKRRKGPRYTPVSRRQDRPDAIAWLLRYHPELNDSQIIKLVGTTKPTIESIRDRTHWNSPNLTPKDPVTLGLCAQSELDAAVRKASDRVLRERGPIAVEEDRGGTLRPAEETQSPEVTAANIFGQSSIVPPEAPAEEDQEIDEDKVFAKLAGLKRAPSEEDEDESR
ncbi:hypothetical protein FHS85_003814 [Rhodoligotrophos appendicifer]|uniref:DUF1013 domain-containing protein n=1 Tax=Rhodoligotrophos appendicifer TaxID=987056 RepID=UPI0011865A22|nr:cell cycle transcriptional regulator TrcR [Rhodoligotrophos appendicifer]